MIYINWKSSLIQWMKTLVCIDFLLETGNSLIKRKPVDHEIVRNI